MPFQEVISELSGLRTEPTKWQFSKDVMSPNELKDMVMQDYTAQEFWVEKEMCTLLVRRLCTYSE